MKRENLRAAWRATSFFALAFLVSPCIPVALSSPSHPSLTQQRQIEGDVASLAFDVIRANPKVEGQGFIGKPKVSYDTTNKVIYIDLGKGAVPKIYTPALEEQLQYIQTNVITVFEGQLDVPEVRFLFGGVDIYHFFPEERSVDGAELRKEKSENISAAANPIILISPSHGLRKLWPADPKKVSWGFQRPVLSGEDQEDTLTPFLANEFKSVLSTRSSAVTSYLTRSTSSDVYVDSCRGNPQVCNPFKDMAARY